MSTHLLILLLKCWNWKLKLEIATHFEFEAIPKDWLIVDYVTHSLDAHAQCKKKRLMYSYFNWASGKNYSNTCWTWQNLGLGLALFIIIILFYFSTSRTCRSKLHTNPLHVSSTHVSCIWNVFVALNCIDPKSATPMESKSKLTMFCAYICTPNLLWYWPALGPFDICAYVSCVSLLLVYLTYFQV